MCVWDWESFIVAALPAFVCDAVILRAYVASEFERGGRDHCSMFFFFFFLSRCVLRLACARVRHETIVARRAKVPVINDQ